MNIFKTVLTIGAFGGLSILAANAAENRGQHPNSTHRTSSSRSSRSTKTGDHSSREASTKNTNRTHKRNADAESRANKNHGGVSGQAGPTDINDQVELPRRESDDENNDDYGDLMKVTPPPEPTPDQP